MSRLKQLENDATMICDMYRPVKTLPRAIKRSLERLEKGIDVSKHCRERQHFLRCSRLALMHERNMYLRKLRIIEELGRRHGWHIRRKGESELLREVYLVLNQT